LLSSRGPSGLGCGLAGAFSTRGSSAGTDLAAAAGRVEAFAVDSAWARPAADRGATVERDDDEAAARVELAGACAAAGRVAATVGGGSAAVTLDGGGAAVTLGGGGAAMTLGGGGAAEVATAACTSCTLSTVISSGRSAPDTTCIPGLGATGVDAPRTVDRQAMTTTTRTIVMPKLPSTMRYRAIIASALSSTRRKPGCSDETGASSSCCSRIVLGDIAPFPLTDGNTLSGYD
jgi:hypothetical protein